MSEPKARLRSVVDNNLFVSGILFERGNPYALLEAWRNGRFLLLLSDEQHDELVDVLARPKFVARFRLASAELTRLLADLATTPRVPLSLTIPLPVRDPKDEYLLAAAIGGAADYLVSGDKDLLVLAADPRLGALRIVTAAEFLTILDRVSPVG